MTAWGSEQGFAYTMLLRRMRAAGIPESDYPRGQDLLDQMVFHEEGFNKIVNTWDPEGGRSFKNYFKRAIALRCGDVIRRLKSLREPANDDAKDKPEKTAGENNTETTSRRRAAKLLKALQSLNVLLKRERDLWEETGEEDDVANSPYEDAPELEERAVPVDMAAKLADALAALEKEQGRGNPNLGREARAALELKYKAYLPPHGMGTYTLQTVETQSGHSVDELRQEYLDDQQLFTKLDDSLTAASKAIERFESRQASQADGLHRRGYTGVQVTALEAEGRKRSAHKGDSSGESGLQRSPVEETYVKLCSAFVRLKRIRQILLEENKKYEHAADNSTWTRSEPEVGELLGMPQPTVHRRLDFGEDFLRRWGN